MKTWITAAAALVLTSGSVLGAQTSVSIGINIGSPPPPRVVYVAPPPVAPGYVWIDGYWYPVKHKHNKYTYEWHDGYWTQPPYAGARWVPARYDRQVFFVGYWDGARGRVEHDHRWD